MRHSTLCRAVSEGAAFTLAALVAAGERLEPQAA